MRAFHTRLLIVWGLLLTPLAQAFYGDLFHLDPTLKWRTLETPHFRVVYEESLHWAAGRVGLYLEEAHSLLQPRFRWEPRTKTSVILVDNEDSANGLSAAAFRIGMVLRLAPPDTTSTIRWYDNWLRMLILHEYTHHLNIDPTTDFWEGLRLVFGDGIRPNGLWPRWMIEGLAVSIESEMTDGGRGRSTYWNMVLRTAVAENVLDTSDFITIDRLNGDIPYFPGGDTAYLFGYEMMKKAASKSETRGQALGDLSFKSSGAVPFFINSHLEGVIGHTWTGLWDEWVEETRARAHADLKTIAQQPVSEPQILDVGLGNENLRGLGLALSPNGRWIAFKGHTADVWAGIYLRDLETGEQTRLMDTLEGSAFGFTPDSEALVVSSLRRTETDVEFSDLAVIPLMQNGELNPSPPVWLTHQARAKDPAVSREPISGKVRVAFTKTREGTVGLAWAELNLVNGQYELANVEELYWPQSGEVVSHPSFSPQGKSVAFSLHRRNSMAEDIVEFDLRSRRIRTLVSNGHVNLMPTFRADGVLHYVSNATGVQNVWRLKGKAPEMVTNVTSGLFFPSFDTRSGNSGDLWAQIFTSKGWRIGRFSKPDRALNSPRVQISNPKPLSPSLAAGQSYRSTVEDRPDLVLPATFETSDYSPWPTLAPRSWSPIILGTANSSISLWQIGGTVLGFDALDIHRYLAIGAYNTGFSEFEGFAQYAFRGLGPTLTLSLQDTYSSIALTDFTMTGTKSLVSSLEISTPIERTFSTWTPSLTAAFQRDTEVTSVSGSKTSSGSVMYPSLTGSLGFSNTRSSSLAVIPESGLKVNASAKTSFLQYESPVTKALLTVRPYFEIFPHVVLTPTVAGAWANPRGSVSSARLRAESPGTSIFSSPGGLSLTLFRLRGYPTFVFFPQWIAHANAELHFPIWNIYRGWSTHPFWIARLKGFAYGEVSRLGFYSSTPVTLPSAGGGLTLSGEFLRVPWELSGQVDYGFETSPSVGGALQWAVRLGLGALPF